MARSLKQGKSLEQSLFLEKPHSIECIDHLGNRFKSEAEMCRYYQIGQGTFKCRIKRGMSIGEALTNKKNDGKFQCNDHLGNVYPSVSDMCRHYKISKGSYYSRLSYGYTLEQALTGNSPKIRVKTYKDHLGRTYVSRKKMCEAYGIDSDIFNTRIHSGMSLERALTLKYIPLYKESIDHLGNVFHSVKEMCNHYKINGTTYCCRISRGWTLEEALTIPNNLSLGEYRVSECLKRLNVRFYHDCTMKTVFKELKVSVDWNDFLTELQSKLGLAGYKWSKQKIQKLRPDFVLYTDDDNKIRGVIEFDGEQHQNFVEYFFKTIEDFFRRSHTDFVKQSLWEYLKIPMLRIRYDQEDKIDEMVTHFIANPEQYLTRHNTYLSEEEYWEPLDNTRKQLEYAY